jgi:YD repeat-containing protein
MKTSARLAALALVSTAISALTACEGFTIAGGGDECYTHHETEKRVHTYDSHGQLSQLEIHSNGAPKIVFRYAYDDAGRRVESRRYDPTALETPGMISRVRFDAAGHAVHSESLAGEGGVAIDITRDDRGRPVRSEVHRLPASGEVTRTTPYEITQSDDPNALEGAGEALLQPEPGEIATLWYPVVLREPSIDMTGLPASLLPLVASPERLDITWADASAAPEPVLDTNGDGSLDRYAYQVVVATETTREERWDFNGDGVVDGRRLVTFGADGKPVESISWDETVSPAQVDEHIVYGLDEVVTTSSEKVMTIVYAGGHRVLHTDDLGGDGTIDWEKTYTYDAEGRRTREELDRNVDGRPDQIWTYTYDDNGRLVQEDMEDGNGYACTEP